MPQFVCVQGSDLLKFVRRSTSRDFRIDVTELQKAIEADAASSGPESESEEEDDDAENESVKEDKQQAVRA